MSPCATLFYKTVCALSEDSDPHSLVRVSVGSQGFKTSPIEQYSRTGVYRGIHYFLISAKKHRLWVLVRTASLRRSNEYPQSMFWAET